MKTFLFVVLFSAFCYPQTNELLSIFHSYISGNVVYYQMLDRQNFADGNKIYKEYSKKWHNLQFLETASLLSVGINIGLDNKTNLKQKIADSFLFASIRWIVRDGVYQSLQDNNFFHLSDNSYSSIEKIGTPFIKLFVLSLFLFVRYYLLEI